MRSSLLLLLLAPLARAFTPESATQGLHKLSSTTALQALPTIPQVAAACIIPTLSGYWRREYTVSYAYGTSVAAVGWLVLRSLPNLHSIAAVHAMALIFYGVRLDLYLLYRELFIERFRKLRERIEDKAPPRRLARTPFVLGCSMLYACMAAPLFLTTASYSTTSLLGTSLQDVRSLLVSALVGLTWFGLGVAAIGDTHKSWAKARRGEDALVSGGVYHFWRHPNYTGEIVGWTASACAAAVAATQWSQLGLVGASALGGLGIYSVLTMATSRLEERQQERYGSRPEYQDWVSKSWVGFTKASKQPKK